MGSCGYVPSCQAPIVAASRGLGSANLIRLWEALGCVPPGTRILSLGQRERLDGQSGDEILVVHANRMVEKQWCGLFLGLICFRLVAPPFQLGVVGPFSWYGVYGFHAICR
jgi:hypothetical protein